MTKMGTTMASALKDAGLINARNCDKDFNLAGVGKMSFFTEQAALDFNKYNQKRRGDPVQTAYKCQYYDHWHLTSQRPEDAPSPAPAILNYAKSPLDDLSKSTATKSQKVYALLKAATGTKTLHEIATDANCSMALVGHIAKEHNLPFKRLVSRSTQSQSGLQTRNEITRLNVSELDAEQARLQAQLAKIEARKAELR